MEKDLTENMTVTVRRSTKRGIQRLARQEERPNVSRYVDLVLAAHVEKKSRKRMTLAAVPGK